MCRHWHTHSDDFVQFAVRMCWNKPLPYPFGEFLQWCTQPMGSPHGDLPKWHQRQKEEERKSQTRRHRFLLQPFFRRMWCGCGFYNWFTFQLITQTSSTLLKTGRSRQVCPPLPGVTPPTSCVPYSMAWLEWNMPCQSHGLHWYLHVVQIATWLDWIVASKYGWVVVLVSIVQEWWKCLCLQFSTRILKRNLFSSDALANNFGILIDPHICGGTHRTMGWSAEQQRPRARNHGAQKCHASLLVATTARHPEGDFKQFLN